MLNLIPNNILVSSIIIMPTSRYEALGSELSHINNLPSFKDVTSRVDPMNKLGERKFPELSFVVIKGSHEGYVYDGNDDNKQVDLGDLIAPFILAGTTFKLQLMIFSSSGVEYYGHCYNENGLTSVQSDLAEELPEAFLAQLQNI